MSAPKRGPGFGRVTDDHETDLEVVRRREEASRPSGRMSGIHDRRHGPSPLEQGLPRPPGPIDERLIVPTGKLTYQRSAETLISAQNEHWRRN
jgi:hypothetical protein